MELSNVVCGDCLELLKEMPDNSVDMILTSPPYWSLRKYGDSSKELGQEKTFQEYIAKLLVVFNEVKRILKPTGTCFVNISDTYVSNSELPQSIGIKSLALVPYRFAIGMIDNGWICRNVVVWYKRNAMPSSVKDRFSVDFEPIFFFVKNKKYYFKQQFEPYSSPLNRWGGDSLRIINKSKSKWDEGTGQNTHRNRDMRPNKNGKNMRTLWNIPTKSSSISHCAMYPEALVERMIKAGCPEEGGIVLDPFAGAGNTLTTAKKLGRNFIGIELYQKYVDIINKRLTDFIV